MYRNHINKMNLMLAKVLGISEEKAKELRQFSEIGVQRFFIRSREEAEEQELEEQLRKAQMEENNEY